MQSKDIWLFIKQFSKSMNHDLKKINDEKLKQKRYKKKKKAKKKKIVFCVAGMIHFPFSFRFVTKIRHTI